MFHEKVLRQVWLSNVHPRVYLWCQLILYFSGNRVDCQVQTKAILPNILEGRTKYVCFVKMHTVPAMFRILHIGSNFMLAFPLHQECLGFVC